MLRTFASLAALVVLIVLLVVVLLHSLDRPWIKQKLQALVHSAGGVVVDYRTARIDLLSGAEIEGLVVQSPPAVRSFAADLAQIGHLEAHWSLHSLLGGGTMIERAAISDLTVTAVVDEHGTTSFDRLVPAHTSPAPPPSKPVPLSQKAAQLLAGAPPIGELEIDRVSLVLVQTDQGQMSTRTELHGAGLALGTSATANGWTARAGLGTAEIPLDLTLTRQTAAGPSDPVSAHARMWLALDAAPQAMKAALDLQMTDQTFAPTVGAKRWLHAEANVDFDAAARKTEIRIDHTEAGDGSATLDAEVEAPDGGDVVVRHAQGTVNLARLLTWLPAGMVPVTVARAELRYQIASLVTGSVVHLSSGGSANIDADLSDIAMSAASGDLAIADATISVHAAPTADGSIAGTGSVKLGATKMTGSAPLSVDGLGIDFDGTQATDGAIAGRANVHFASLDRGGASPIALKNGDVGAVLQGLLVNGAAPLASKGDIVFDVSLGQADVKLPAQRIAVDGLKLHAHTKLEGRAPYAIDFDAPMTRLRVTDSTGRTLTDSAARVDVRADHVEPDAALPTASRGNVHASLELGELRASLDSVKSKDALDFTVQAKTGSLKTLRPFLPPDLSARIPLDGMTMTVKSSGQVAHLDEANPSVQETTEIALDHPAFETTAAKSIDLILRSRGDLLHQQADVDLRTVGLSLGSDAPHDDHLTLSMTLNRQIPSLAFQLATEGRAAAETSGTLSFDPSRHAVVYEIRGKLGGLAPLRALAARIPALQPFDLSELAIEGSAKGALFGAITDIARDGSLKITADPLRSANLEGNASLKLTHAKWTKGDTAIVLPDLTWHGEMRSEDKAGSNAKRVLESHLDLSSVHLDLGSRDVDLNGVHQDATISVSGDLKNPDVELTQKLDVRAIEQTFAPAYPTGDLSFTLAAERGPENVIHVTDLKLTNGLGGTALSVRGNVDLGEGRRTLSLTTAVTQELGHLSTLPDRFKGRGSVAIEANVTSPDFVHLKVKGVVKGDKVSALLPRAGFDVEDANGEVPVTVALEVTDRGVALERTEAHGGFSMLRFADQHPLLARSGVLSIAKLQTPFVTIAPLVGNLELDENVISLRQFEMGVRGGTITGLCGIDWDGPRSTVELHVRASGVQSSHGEPFDGNIAIALSAADRTIDGRAEIIKIGKRHLLDLLDLQDPQHADAGMNRIRTALIFGYPSNLRLVFDHGFANAHLELGGLAQLVSIGDLKGIPMGPIVDKMLAGALDANNPADANADKETP